MTDKRSESARVSARPPLPSIAPPTDDIDSEWGADDDIPAPARLPQLSASLPATATPVPAAATAVTSTPVIASAPPPVAALATPLPATRLPTPIPTAPRAATPIPAAPRAPTPVPTAPRAPTPVPAAPRPASSALPIARASAPAAAPSPASALTIPTTTNPLRKQTLLGIAPVLPTLAQPPTATEPPSASATAATPPEATAAAAASSTPLAVNPLRKQTLFGIAPVLPTPAPPAPAAAAEDAATAATEHTRPSEETLPADDEQARPLPSSPAAGIGSSSPPFTRDVSTTSVAPAAAPAFSSSSTEHELRALRPRRSRWLLPVGAAALIALGVVGLRRLDNGSRPASPPTAPAAAQPAAAIDRQPEPLAPTPAPSANAAADNAADDAKPEPSSAAAEPLTKPSEAATADVRKVQIESDPPGARMFWRGKEVGTTPFTLELQPGEKHSYELGLPGYVTRKVVIDGSKSEISIGMKPETRAFTGVAPRK